MEEWIALAGIAVGFYFGWQIGYPRGWTSGNDFARKIRQEIKERKDEFIE